MNCLQPAFGILGSRNNLCVRLTRSDAEIVMAQKLRFQVFYEELKANPDPSSAKSRMDTDRFDEFCDHLIVVNQTAPDTPRQFEVDDGEMVGTYRLLRQCVAEKNDGFYTQSEFDIAPLLAAKPDLRFLELGLRLSTSLACRSCQNPGYFLGAGTSVLSGCSPGSRL